MPRGDRDSTPWSLRGLLQRRRRGVYDSLARSDSEGSGSASFAKPTTDWSGFRIRDRLYLDALVRQFSDAQSRLASRTFRDRMLVTLKEAVSYSLASLMVLIVPVSQFFGPMVFIALLPVTMASVSSSLGANVQYVVTCMIGALMGVAAGICTALSRQANEIWLAVLLLIFITLFTLIKAVNPSLEALGATACVILIIVAFSDGEPGQMLDLMTSAITSYLIGLCVALVMGVCVFPERATGKFRLAMGALMNAVDESLQLALVDIALAVDKQHPKKRRKGQDNAVPFSDEDREENLLPDVERLAKHRRRHVAKITMARRAIASLPTLRDEAQWEFGRVFYHFDQYQACQQVLAQMVRLVSAVGCSSEDAAQAFGVLEMSPRTNPDTGPNTDLPEIRLPPAMRKTRRGSDQSDTASLITVTSTRQPQPPTMLAMGIMRSAPSAYLSSAPPAHPPGVGLSASVLAARKFSAESQQDDLLTNASTRSLQNFDMTPISAQQSAREQIAAAWVAAQRRLSLAPEEGDPDAPSTVPPDPLDQGGDFEESADVQAVDTYLRAMRRPIAAVQTRFSRYCQEVARFSHNNTDECLDEFIIEDLRQVVEQLDEEQGNVLSALDPRCDLNFIHFRVFCLRELVLELITLVSVMNSMKPASRSIRTGLQRLFQHSLQPKIDSTSLRETDRRTETWRHWVWRHLDSMNSIKFKFALKTGVASTLMAILSFTSFSRDIYYVWRGTWSLVAIAMCSSPTFGGNIQSAANRLLGNICGALVSILAWVISPNQPIGLFFIIFLFANAAFYIKLHVPRFGGIGDQALGSLYPILLAYYSSPYLDSVYASIYEIAYKRALAIAVGVLVALFIGRVIWPYLARTSLRRRLSSVMVNLGRAFSILQAHLEDATLVTVGEPVLQQQPPTPEELERCAQRVERMVEKVKKKEAAIEAALVECANLHATARLEPRLKGPWPSKEYMDTIEAFADVLNHITFFRVLLQRGVGSELHQELVIPLKRERRLHGGDVMLYFFVLSAAMLSKLPLPPRMPPVLRSVNRQIEKVQRLMPHPRTAEGRLQLSLFFAHHYNLRELASQLESAGQTTARLFGVNRFVAVGDDTLVAALKQEDKVIEERSKLDDKQENDVADSDTAKTGEEEPDSHDEIHQDNIDADSDSARGKDKSDMV